MFKLRKSRKFDYQPQYYDAGKEELAYKKKLIAQNSATAVQKSLRQQFAENRKESRLSSAKGQKYRVLIIFAILLFGFYLVFTKL